MRNLKALKLAAIGLTSLVVAALFSGGPALGQGQFFKFKIPYTFNFGGRQLPAGEYSFSVDDRKLVAQPASSGRFSENIITRITGPVEFFRDGSLVFEKSADSHTLSEVWIPGADGVLVHSIPKGHGRDIILPSGLSETSPVSGKVAFNQTCARCHGRDGNGDKDASKFFGTVIPKLTSPEIQAKTDADLRQLISRGNEKMPPVEIDEAGFRHRLPPQDVEAVIAYFRTLKR